MSTFHDPDITVPCPPTGPAAAALPQIEGYDLIRELGRGAGGVVYLAHDRQLKRLVALKMIRAEEAPSARDVQRFHFEAEAAAALAHPNIVPIYAIGEKGGHHFFSMKFVAGGSLAERLRNSPRPSPRQAARLVVTVARAVHHAHQRGILHRDLKPANVLLDEQSQPHVSDLGLARRFEGSGALNQSVTVEGTPGYMAPEQATAQKVLTTATDVYGLGAILYELLTGQPPFCGSSLLAVLREVVEQAPPAPRSLVPSVDRDLEAICLHCLEKAPAGRYPSAEAVADDLERYLRGEAVSVSPPGMWDWFIQSLRTRPPVSSNYRWPAMVWHGTIALAVHTAVFGVVHTQQSVQVLWVVLALAWGGMALGFWRLASRFRLLNGTERHSLLIGIGSLIGQIILFGVTGPTTLDAPVRDVLHWYPPLALTSGLSLFISGTTHWGRLHLAGLSIMMLAFPLAWFPGAAPLLYGCAIAATLWWWAFMVRRYFLRPDKGEGD